jgi:primase-polymerase (primpol)-like protein
MHKQRPTLTIKNKNSSRLYQTSNLTMDVQNSLKSEVQTILSNSQDTGVCTTRYVDNYRLQTIQQQLVGAIKGAYNELRKIKNFKAESDKTLETLVKNVIKELGQENGLELSRFDEAYKNYTEKKETTDTPKLRIPLTMNY